MVDKTLHRFLESFIPPENREWFTSLLSQFPQDDLEIFVADHSAEELTFLFSWIPNWGPPAGKSYLDFGSNSLLPIYPKAALHLALNEQRTIRRKALQIVGTVADPLAAAFEILKWVFSSIEWGAAWGVRAPSEILESQKGSCLHLAQSVLSLLRSLFLPCRLIESISLVPEALLREELKCWEGLPDIFKTWHGEGVWSHVLCEVLIEGKWIPLDPSSCQFGFQDIQQHIRTPERLLLLARTYADNEESFSISNRYILEPLLSANENENSVLRSSLARIENVAIGNILNCRDQTMKIQAEISAVKSLAEKRSEQCRNHIVVDSVFVGKLEHLHVSAAINVKEPLVEKYIVTKFPLSERQDRSLESLNGFENSNRHYIVILDYFPSKEGSSRKTLQALGYDLGDWVVPPGRDPVTQAKLVGDGERETPLYCDIHVPFTRTIVSHSSIGERKSVLVGTTGELIAVKLLAGNILVSLIPRALIGGASPKVYGILTSNHRRILGVLVN